MVPTLPIRERRRLKRTAQRQRASLVVTRSVQVERIPCIILDASPDGFRVGGTFRVRPGQIVELLFEESPFSTVKCTVRWVGKPGSQQQGQLGLRTFKPEVAALSERR